MKYIGLYILNIFILHVNDVKSFSWHDLPKDCGKIKVDKSDDQKPDGDKVSAGQFPWHARIGKVIDQNTIIFFCSGALIHSKYVVSAAHCGNLGTMVRLGMNNIDPNSNEFNKNTYQDIEIDNVEFADHCRLTNVNDLSIVILKTSAQFNEFVQPICLPNRPLSVRDVKTNKFYVSGWGAVYSGFGNVNPNDYNNNNIFRFSEIAVLQQKYCKSIGNRVLEQNEFCMQYVNKEVTSCVADSGSPAVTVMNKNGEDRHYIIGLASHNLTVCKSSPVSPFICTDVSQLSYYIIRLIEYIIRVQFLSRSEL